MSLLYQASFFTSVVHMKQLPNSNIPEICFIGRSNSGKSSAINAITHQNNLSFTGKIPGRTRSINMFKLSMKKSCQTYGYLVDLPGYGYAAVKYKEKIELINLLNKYLKYRSSLTGIVLMIDIRRGLVDLDKNFIKMLVITDKPILVLLTKADKLSYMQRMHSFSSIQKDLSNIISDIRIIPFSSLLKIGLKQVEQHITNWIFKIPNEVR